MRKLLCLLLVFTALGLQAQNAEVQQLMRQTTATRNTTDISNGDVQFWIGEGSNEILVGFFACGPSTAGGWAYGYRFNGTVTIQDMLIDINNADPNFSINFSGTMIDDYSYNNGTLNYNVGYGMLTYTVNDTWASGLSDELHNGDLFIMAEWGDCDIPNTNIYYPVDPNAPTAPTDATIDAENIVYWVGNGNNKAILAVNWCDSAIAMAWGVKFDGDSALVADIMHTVALYDSRFNYIADGGMLSNITFQDGNYNLSLHGNWWMYNINGVGAMNGFESQFIHNGDLIKWGDESCGNVDENWNYAWTTPIQPVALPAPSTEIFDGIIGSTNCQAIAFDNPAILGWANTCTITRGYQDIALAGELASYGDENTGTGAASAVTTDAVSLGDAGYAVLTFPQPISNGEGYDFAVFENSLNHTFLELAFVEVSSDGIHFYRFPSVSNTATDQQIGNAGSIDAQNLHNLAGKYTAGWGTPFDLAELDGYSNLDINNVTHIRLVDVVGSIDPQYGSTDKNGHIINDPYPTAFESCGFDLTGVAILNGWTPSDINNYTENNNISVYPNPCQHTIVVNNVTLGEEVSLFNAFGQLISTTSANNTNCTFDMQAYPAGIYFVKTGTQTCKVVKR